jgi:hypothetical protein
MIKPWITKTCPTINDYCLKDKCLAYKYRYHKQDKFSKWILGESEPFAHCEFLRCELKIENKDKIITEKAYTG